jgi:hypothetical protein
LAAATHHSAQATGLRLAIKYCCEVVQESSVSQDDGLFFWRREIEEADDRFPTGCLAAGLQLENGFAN